MEIKWDNSISVNEIELDNQHKKLFERANDLINSRMDNKDALNFLEGYVIENFLYEEYFQKLNNYPGYEFHKEFHFKFIKRLAELSIKYENGEYEAQEIKNSIIKMMNEWFREHILNEDIKFIEFLKKNNLGLNNYKLRTKWNEELLIGIEEVDKQHKEIFTRTEKMFDELPHGNKEKVVKEMIEFLTRYLNEHFKTEERVQAEIDYPDLISHKVMHTKFSRDVIMLKLKINNNEIDITTIVALAGLVNNWLMEHINDEDMRFGEYFKSRLKD